jgi:hypothetical protein
MLYKGNLYETGGSEWECKSVFRPEFKTYEVKIPAMKMATDNVQMKMQFSADNGASYLSAAIYDSQAYEGVAGSWSSPISLDGSTYATVGGYGNQGAVGNEGAGGHIIFCDPLNPSARKNGLNQWMIWRYNGHTTCAIGTFSYETSDPLNAFKLYPSSGNFDSNANFNSVTVWGYR